MAQAQKASKSTSNSTHPVADKVKESLHSSVDSLSDKAAETEQMLRENSSKGAEALAARKKEMEAKWEESPVKRFASENPVATAGIAFAAGMLVSSLIKRK